MTITEALAKLKTLKKRIIKKQEFIRANIMRQAALKDPLADDGGSVDVIDKERQAIADLEAEYVGLRQAISHANGAASLNVCGETKTIEGWLLWRREIAPGRREFVNLLLATIRAVRNDAMSKGVSFDPKAESAKPADILVHINEKELSDEIESLEETLGTLDGALSQVNATVTI